jgi:hypothetical protein
LGSQCAPSVRPPEACGLLSALGCVEALAGRRPGRGTLAHVALCFDRDRSCGLRLRRIPRGDRCSHYGETASDHHPVAQNHHDAALHRDTCVRGSRRAALSVPKAARLLDGKNGFHRLHFPKLVFASVLLWPARDQVHDPKSTKMQQIPADQLFLTVATLSPFFRARSLFVAAGEYWFPESVETLLCCHLVQACHGLEHLHRPAGDYSQGDYSQQYRQGTSHDDFRRLFAMLKSSCQHIRFLCYLHRHSGV